MSRLLKLSALVLVLFLAAQVIRPERTNPPTDSNHTIHAHLGAAPALTVIDRACSDCHSNQTAWPSYTGIAPISWLMVYGVSKGRKAVNFSEWTGYSPEVQQALLAESCRDVSTGKMPGAYTVLHPEMRLSAQDVDAICSLSTPGL